MKKYIYICMLLPLINCTTSREISSYNTNDCIENLRFKKDFFHRIKIVDSLVYRSQNKEFKKSLGFISKYSHVSFEDIGNYFNHYPGTSYNKDRKGWIEWYEKNKCSNIQFKKK